MSREEVRNRWAAAEQVARQAEMKIASIGQAAPDPRMADLLREASRLREEADRLFRELIEFGSEPKPF